MRACRVIPDHAAESRAIRRRRVGTEQVTHRFQMEIELLLDNARFYESPPFLGVDVKYFVEVLRHVHNDGFSDSLTRETRTSAPGKHGYPKVPCNLHCGKDIFVSSWEYDAYRLDFINAGVGAVEKAADFVEADFARDARLKRLV